MESYRTAARAQVLAAEEQTAGYPTELADYWATHQRLTFRVWLTSYRETA